MEPPPLAPPPLAPPPPLAAAPTPPAAPPAAPQPPSLAPAPVAVFDSGIGSLSVVRRIRRAVPGAPVVYLADEASYPYGTKEPAELRRAVAGRIRLLSSMFRPALVVVGSVTPTLLCPDLFDDPRVVGVGPPLRRAAEATRTGRIGVLATSSVVASGRIERLARSLGLSHVEMRVIDASPLVDLVESGAFLGGRSGGRDRSGGCDDICSARIKEVAAVLGAEGIDSVALSSTHLPFLSERLSAALPGVRLADPGDDAAAAVRDRIAGAGGAPGPLRVYTTGDPARLGARLRRLGVREEVRRLGPAP